MGVGGSLLLQAKSFRRRPTLPGGEPPSTIGAGGFHDRVRDGNGWVTSAMAAGKANFFASSFFSAPLETKGTDSRTARQARPISTAPLSPSRGVHARPINLVVFQGSFPFTGRKPHLGVGFALRCLQRFSRPDLATQRCTGRHNWYTLGPSIPVLSY